MIVGPNIELSEHEYKLILSLEKFDLEMFLSEINDHGWPVAKVTFQLIEKAINAVNANGNTAK